MSLLSVLARLWESIQQQEIPVAIPEKFLVGAHNRGHDDKGVVTDLGMGREGRGVDVYLKGKSQEPFAACAPQPLPPHTVIRAQ